MTFSQLESKIQNAKTIDFGDIFNKSIELFKKVWVQGLVVLVLTMAVIMPFYFVMYVPLIAMGITNPQSFEQGNDLNPVMMIYFVLFMIVFVLIATTIGFAFKAAFYRICKNKDLGVTAKDDYFYFFKKPYLGKVIKLAAITVGISFLAMLLCGLPLIYAVVPLSFINIIFAFNPELTESEIVKASFNIGNKKWLITFGLMIVAGLLAEIVGLMLCLVGIFATAAFAYLPLYFIYKEAIGFETHDAIQDIGKTDQV